VPVEARKATEVEVATSAGTIDLLLANSEGHRRELDHQPDVSVQQGPLTFALEQAHRDLTYQPPSSEGVGDLTNTPTPLVAPKDMPTLEDAMLLFDEYFYNFNSACPLWDRTRFFDLVGSEYSNGGVGEPEIQGALNITLALAYRLRAIANAENTAMNHKAWHHFRTASGCIFTLILKHPTLRGLQVLLAIAIFLHGAQYHQAALGIAKLALQSVNHLKLHRRRDAKSLGPTDRFEYSRTFWITDSLMVALSVKTRAPTIDGSVDIQDIATDLSIGFEREMENVEVLDCSQWLP